MAPSERFNQGMATRRAVLGDRYVDNAEQNKSAFDAPFQALITAGDVHKSDNTDLVYELDGNGGYCVTGTNSETGHEFHYASAVGKVEDNAC